MRLSAFGEKFSATSGISELMHDLASALAEDSSLLMLGGGAPSHIPAVEACFRQRMRQLLENEREFGQMVGDYDGPQGHKSFVEALAALLRKEFGFDISPENVALTNGSQAAFFFLFNMFAGKFKNGTRKKILLPLNPEYIGYTDVGLTHDFFVANRPGIEHIDAHTFKYHVDFDTLPITDEIGAICVSRPTNPTGNVLTDDEIAKLCELASARDIPMIIDNAYGTPFPNIIFVDAKPVWNERTIICMSLSKLGLPAARTGIVIANKDIIAAVSAMNAVLNLAPGSLGPSMALDLVRSGAIIDLSRDVIRPYYQKKAKSAMALLLDELDDVDFHIHKPEGAMFLWLWFRGMPITSRELYERLRKRGVLVVPGHYFFPGLEEEWSHKHECIRITYSQDDRVVNEGVKIIAAEVKKAYKE